MNRVVFLLGFIFLFCGQVFAASPNDVTIIYSGQTLGYLKPCPTCGAKSYGGLARRAGIMKIEREENPHCIVVDAGGFAPQLKVDEKRAKICLEIMAYMGYDAITVTGSDLANGPDKLKEWTKNGPEIVTTNLIDKTTGKTWGKKYFLKEVNGKTVAVLGLMSPQSFYRKSLAHLKKKFEILDPETALKDALKELGNKPDFTVLLSQNSRSETYDMARENGKVDMIVNSKLGRRVWGAKTLRPIFVVTENRAFELGVLTIDIKDKHSFRPLEMDKVLLDRSVLVDPQVNKMLAHALPEKQKGTDQDSLNPTNYFRYLNKLN